MPRKDHGGVALCGGGGVTKQPGILPLPPRFGHCLVNFAQRFHALTEREQRAVFSCCSRPQRLQRPNIFAAPESIRYARCDGSNEPG